MRRLDFANSTLIGNATFIAVSHHVNGNADLTIPVIRSCLIDALEHPCGKKTFVEYIIRIHP